MQGKSNPIEEEAEPVEEYVPYADSDEGEEMGLGPKIRAFLLSPVWTVLVIILVAISAFFLGRFAKLKESIGPVRILDSSSKTIEVSNNIKESAAVINSEPAVKVGNVAVVGSKNGTKYHLPTCPGAKQISEKNLITFSSIEEAKGRGYTPAANCPGLKGD